MYAKRTSAAQSPLRPAGAEEVGLQSTTPAPSAVAADVVSIYFYRHLLRNVARQRRAIEIQRMKTAPRVVGPRVAALLARLWASEDLNLPPVPQKAIALDLGLGEGEVGKMLKALRAKGSNGQPCVELVSDTFRRENLYKITKCGQNELQNWILANHTHESFSALIKSIPPNASNVTRTLDALRKEAKRELGSPE